METLGIIALKFAVFALIVHLATVLLALRRLRVPEDGQSDFAKGPPVSIIRPVRGLDASEKQALRSTFALAYPGYEVLFCCASPDDDAVPFLRALIAEHPSVPAQLLIGDDRISGNPKLNNIVKGWDAAAHPWVAIVDSNLDLPRDYLQRLFAAWTPGTGLVSAPPIGADPADFGAEFECAFLNTYQARWQYTADTLGLGFAQGKTLFWRKADLDAAGGLTLLGLEPAEDAASTKVVRGLGLRVRLADGVFAQPLGSKSVAQVWARHVRWARLRRSTFPLLYTTEILSGLAAPLLALVLAAMVLDFDVIHFAVLYVLTWFSAEAALAAGVGWHLSWRSPAAWIARELSLPVLWVQGWLGNSFNWQGNAMTAARGAQSRSGVLAALTLAGLGSMSDS